MNKIKIPRETFSSGFAVFFATLGSAVGLGNIWKFPVLVGTNGGGAFVFTYLICVLLVGMPVMISEFYIGRKTRRNVIGAFDVLKAKPYWKSIGYMGIAAACLIMFFYSAVAGWVYSILCLKQLKVILQGLQNMDATQAAASVGTQFSETIGTMLPPIMWQAIVLIVVSAILIAGVKNGIERITKTLMPVLFILIILCDIRALTLPGAAAGLNFLFHVDFKAITPAVILSAMGLSFFKLSLGMGTMITYGSYFTEDNNLIATSAKVAFSDTLVSLLAGIAIFPVVFTYGMQPNGGPGLLFQSYTTSFFTNAFRKYIAYSILLIGINSCNNSYDFYSRSTCSFSYRRERYEEKCSGSSYNRNSICSWEHLLFTHRAYLEVFRLLVKDFSTYSISCHPIYCYQWADCL